MQHSSKSSLEWGPLRNVLQKHFSFSEIKGICGLAGMDLVPLAHLDQRSRGGVSKGQLLTAIDKEFGEMHAGDRNRFLRIATEEILKQKELLHDELREYLQRLGWTLQGKIIIPMVLFDPFDMLNLPDESTADITKAAQRLRDGDLSGAITSACAAVDAATTGVFHKYSLGAAGGSSFQERINKSCEAIGIFSQMEAELRAIGWKEESKKTIGTFRNAIHHAAYLMQTLRSDMGDVHGTKPVLMALVFDALKWAQIILRLLKIDNENTNPSRN